MSFRVSIAQQPLAWHDPPANRAHFASILAPLAGNTDLVILPEMFTTGFTMNPDAFAEPADGETRAWLLAQAAALDAAVGGSVAVNDGGRHYNRFMLALPGGLPTGTTSGTCSAWPGSIASTKAAATR
jgi:predicted amidohydrolase